MQNFRAYRIDQQDKKVVADFCTMAVEDLTDGDVVIKVSHSTINYKDANLLDKDYILSKWILFTSEDSILPDLIDQLEPEGVR